MPGALLDLGASDRVVPMSATHRPRVASRPAPRRRSGLYHCTGRDESGMRKILKPAISGKPSAASRDTKAKTAAGHLAADQPIDRLRLTLAQLDFRCPRCRDRGPDNTAEYRIPVVYRNDLVG